jgi:hypothetical protein
LLYIILQLISYYGLHVVGEHAARRCAQRLKDLAITMRPLRDHRLDRGVNLVAGGPRAEDGPRLGEVMGTPDG